jgi:hypothetical protein
MFTGNEDMEATSLRQQGWTFSAIACHLGRDRATVRDHLNGTRVAGERRRSEPDPFEAFVPNRPTRRVLARHRAASPANAGRISSRRSPSPRVRDGGAHGWQSQ